MTKTKKTKMSKEIRSYRRYLKGLFVYQSPDKAFEEGYWHLEEDYGTMMIAEWKGLEKYLKKLYKNNGGK